MTKTGGKPESLPMDALPVSTSNSYGKVPVEIIAGRMPKQMMHWYAYQYNLADLMPEFLPANGKPVGKPNDLWESNL